MKALLNRQEFDLLTKNNQPIIKVQNMDLKETTTSFKLNVNLGIFDYLNKDRNGKSNYKNLWFYSPILGDNFRIKLALMKDEDAFNALSDRIALAIQEPVNSYTLKEIEDFLNIENAVVATSVIHPKINNLQSSLLLENFPPETSLGDTKVLPNGRLTQEIVETLNTQDELTLYSVECEANLEFKKDGASIGFLGIVVYPDVQFEDIKTGVGLEQIREFYKFSQVAITYNLYNSDSSLNQFFVAKPELFTEEISLNQKNRYLESLVPKLSYSPKSSSRIQFQKDTFFSDLFSSESTTISESGVKNSEVLVNCFFMFDYLNYVIKKSSVYNFLNSFYTEEQLYIELSKNDNKIFSLGKIFLKNLSNQEIYEPKDLIIKKSLSTFDIAETQKLLFVDFSDDVNDNFEREVTFKFVVLDPLIDFLFATKQKMQETIIFFEQYRGRIDFLIGQNYYLLNNKFNLSINDKIFLNNLKNKIIQNIQTLSIFDESFLRVLDILLDPENLNLSTLNSTIEKINFLFQDFIKQSQNYSTKTIEDEYIFKTTYFKKTLPIQKVFLTPTYRNGYIPHFINIFEINNLIRSDKPFYEGYELKFGPRLISRGALPAIQTIVNRVFSENRIRINPSGQSELDLAIFYDFSKSYSKFWDFLYDENFLDSLSNEEIVIIYEQLTRNINSTVSLEDKKQFIISLKNEFLRYIVSIDNIDPNILSHYKTKNLFQKPNPQQAIYYFIYNANYKAYVLTGFETKNGARNMRKPIWRLINANMVDTFNFISSNNLSAVLNIAPLEIENLGIKRPTEIEIPTFMEYVVFDAQKIDVR